MSEIEIQAQEVESKALTLPEKARAIVIQDDADYSAAGDFLTTHIKAIRAEINETFDPAAKKAHEAHKAILAAKRKVEGPVVEAEGIVKTSMADYHRKREQERLALEAEARKRAQEEAERKRLEEAAALEDAGRKEQAEALLDKPLEVVAPPVEAAPKAEGVSVRKVMDFRIVNKGEIKPLYLLPDEKRIRQVVVALGYDAAKAVGGIEVFEKEIVSARRR